jgi:ABC-type transport system involved in multi-copper enzyme maturation permease subunit
MLYGIAFIGGWVEQIGAILRNETAVDLGIVSSLFMPADVLWKYASTVFQSTNIMANESFAGPFTIGSQPSDSVIFYGLVYVSALLLLAMWSFTRRDL